MDTSSRKSLNCCELWAVELWVELWSWSSPNNKTSDVFSLEYKANTSRRIGFSADAITNTSLNIRPYSAFAMDIVGICPNIT